jgi:hypothetical protein
MFLWSSNKHSDVFSLQSVPRSVASQIMIEETLASCSGGPRGNKQ